MFDLHEKVYWWKIFIRVNATLVWLEVRYSMVIGRRGSIQKADILFLLCENRFLRWKWLFWNNLVKVTFIDFPCYAHTVKTFLLTDTW